MDLLMGLAGLAGLSALLQSKTLPTEKEYIKAQGELNLKPDDPAANLIVGKYKTFVENDFQFGLQHLAKGSDKVLAALAQKELDETNSDTPEKKVALGDEWVITAKKYPALTTQFYDHASEWYVAAWPRLDEKWKARLRDQGRKLALSRPQGPPRKAFAPGWTAGAGAVMDGTMAHTGSYSAKLLEKDPKAPAGELIFASDPIPVAGKKFLELTAYVMSDSTENPTDAVYVNIFDDTGSGVGTWSTLIPVDVPFWRKFSIKKEIPEKIVFVRVGTVKRSKNGAIWSDDFSLRLDNVEALKNGSFEQK